jgi:RecB family exonuclease
VITARRTRLVRAADLQDFRALLARLTASADIGDTFVLVPTRAAASELSRTAGTVRAGTRDELYDTLLARLARPPRRYSPVEREAMLAASSREAEDGGHPPPFHLRPALVSEMLALYDHLRRLGRSVDDFERLLNSELEPAAESDRGAAQLLDQTAFLTAAFRRFESRLADSGGVDEHMARARLVSEPAARPLTHLIVAVADRPFDPEGYWPADVTLATTIPGLERIDVVATQRMLDAGYAERLQLAFLDIADEGPPAPASSPTLVVPESGDVFQFRDREDELEGVARRIAAAPTETPLERTALIVARPLPYLYLAREVFAGAGIAYESHDTLPLAAEPYAAAVDVALEAVAANFTRGALLALLRSPHFRFSGDAGEFERREAPELDAALAAHRYLGGLDRLASLVNLVPDSERISLVIAVSVCRELAPLATPRPMTEQIDLLRAFLDRHDRDHRERRRRARAAVMDTLASLSDSYRRHDPSAIGTVTELSALVRRWIGAQTFDVAGGAGGLRILDAQSARFADLDDVQLMGLIEGEWPERPRRNVFYPRALLRQLEPARPERVVVDEERDHVRWGRALFHDLVTLARRRVRVSTFALESDAVVEPSTFIDDLGAFGLPTERERAFGRQAFHYERLMAEPLASGSPWAAARAASATRERARFRGDAGPWSLPRVSVSRVERYLKCPFQFFVANVLQVAEAPEDENARSPLERGRFLHELFETFFHEWQARGRGRITSREMADARALFEEVAEPALRSLPAAEAALERARLFGSAVGSGIADRVFALEAERGVEIRERLMEYELDGEFTFAGEDGSRRAVRLRAKIDRVDLLGDGTFRVIDYKTKYVPDRRTALQLPIYSTCVRTTLAAQRGRDIPVSEAMYLSFEGPQAEVLLEDRGKSIDDLVNAAEHRFVAALDDIARGHYPPRPETRNLCSMCGYVAVCRTAGGLDEDA